MATKKELQYIRRYIKELKTFLLHRRAERRFIKRLHHQMIEYADDVPIRTYEDLISEFGSPQEVAISDDSDKEYDSLLRWLHFRKFIYRAVFFVVLCFCFYTAYDYVLLQRAINYGKTVKTETIILPPVHLDQR